MSGDCYYYRQLAGSNEEVTEFRSRLYVDFHITHFILEDFFLMGEVKITSLRRFIHWLGGAKSVLEPADQVYIGGKRLLHLTEFLLWLEAIKLIVESEEYRDDTTQGA